MECLLHVPVSSLFVLNICFIASMAGMNQQQGDIMVSDDSLLTHITQRCFIIVLRLISLIELLPQQT